MYDLELEITNTDHELLPGMFARVEIVKQDIPDSLSVPIYAIISNNNSHSVFVEYEDLAVKKEIEPGIQDGWMVQVKKGLTKGEKVVITGQRSLNDGQRLNVVREINDLKEMN